MGFQFAETMTGTVEWDAQPGIEHPFSFAVTAEAPSTRRHLSHGKAILRGVVHARPLAHGERIIRYELSFAGGDGRTYQLVGQKDLRWRSPVRTLTYLPAEILDEDHRRVGACKTTFDLRRDWWTFLRSFRPL
jgi:hypothetical protein